MIIVHHLEQSRSQRILWLLEELGIDYDIKHYKRDEQTSLAPPALKKIHPLGKSPLIEDGATILPETGAIVEYLINSYDKAGSLKPADGTPQALDYLYWMHFAEGSLMPPLLLRLVMNKIATAPMPFFAKPIARQLAVKVSDSFIDPNIKSHFDFVEQKLGEQPFFAGSSLSGADIMMSFPLEAAAARNSVTTDRPNIKAYLDRIHTRPAYQTALEKGGPYDYGPQG